MGYLGCHMQDRRSKFCSGSLDPWCTLSTGRGFCPSLPERWQSAPAIGTEEWPSPRFLDNLESMHFNVTEANVDLKYSLTENEFPFKLEGSSRHFLFYETWENMHFNVRKHFIS